MGLVVVCRSSSCSWPGTPLLDLRLFRNRIFLNASLLGYVSTVALFGAEFLMPIYLQALRGRTALETGLILLPMAITGGIFVTLSGRIYDRVGPRPLMVGGFAILMVNTWQLSQIQADTPIAWIMFLLALRGMALGLTVQTTMVTALSVVPRADLARGSSLTNATRLVVQSIGVARAGDGAGQRALARGAGHATGRPGSRCAAGGRAPRHLRGAGGRLRRDCQPRRRRLRSRRFCLSQCPGATATARRIAAEGVPGKRHRVRTGLQGQLRGSLDGNAARHVPARLARQVGRQAE